MTHAKTMLKSFPCLLMPNIVGQSVTQGPCDCFNLPKTFQALELGRKDQQIQEGMDNQELGSPHSNPFGALVADPRQMTSLLCAH